MNDQALSQLAAMVAVQIESALGRMEKRLILMRAFAQAHRFNSAVTEDPDIMLLDALIREPDRLVGALQNLWKDR